VLCGIAQGIACVGCTFGLGGLAKSGIALSWHNDGLVLALALATVRTVAAATMLLTMF